MIDVSVAGHFGTSDHKPIGRKIVTEKDWINLQVKVLNYGSLFSIVSDRTRTKEIPSHLLWGASI